jgi:beta-phosphoglucomutase
LIKGLLFDLDGTLVSTKEANYLSYKEAYQSIGIDMSRENYFKSFGLRFDDMVDIVSPGLSVTEKEKLKFEKSKSYKNNLKLTILNKVLFEIIKNSKSDIKKALITTASKANALEVLRFHHLSDLFDVCIFGEDVVLGKPDSECYDLVINLLELHPSECLIFEDSFVGVCAGSKSGANVLNVSDWLNENG